MQDLCAWINLHDNKDYKHMQSNSSNNEYYENCRVLGRGSVIETNSKDETVEIEHDLLFPGLRLVPENIVSIQNDVKQCLAELKRTTCNVVNVFL